LRYLSTEANGDNYKVKSFAVLHLVLLGLPTQEETSHFGIRGTCGRITVKLILHHNSLKLD